MRHAMALLGTASRLGLDPAAAAPPFAATPPHSTQAHSNKTCRYVEKLSGIASNSGR